MNFYILGVKLKKVLFVAHVDSHIRHFHIPYLKYFHDKGYEVHVATSNDENEKFEYCDKKHTLSIERSPFKLNNLKAINQMFELLKNENYDFVHCNTPMGSVVTRLGIKKYRKYIKKNDNMMTDTEVIYTAHGFHFFKGAPLSYWMIYYPIEKWLSKYTDKLITINKEDYNIALKFKAKKVYKIDGVGVDAQKFNFQMSNDDKKKLKKDLSSIDNEFKMSDSDVVVTYVAELIKRKNQDLIIDVMKDILDDKESPKNVKLLLVGTGELKDYYQKRINDLKLEKNILLTGYRRDVPKILAISDIAISCAKHEGLPFNLVEAQMSGLPCVATDVRGNNEVLEENQTGYLINTKDKKKCKERFKNKLLKLVNSESMRTRMGKNALENSKKYKLSRIIDEMKKIYEE